jgi:flagellin FlaB
MYKTLSKNDKGFTGLEAAIVLIAFVVVAAVFSYVMLGAGFFTTQKSQEVVHTGVTQASSSVVTSGDIIVHGSAAGSSVDQIIFYLTNTAGGTPVDLDKLLITYTDDKYSVTEPYTTATLGNKGPVTNIPTTTWATATTGWVYTGIIVANGAAPGTNMISPGDKYKVVIDLTSFLENGGVSATGFTLPGVNEKITIQLKPSPGPVLSISRILPPSIATGSYYSIF